MTQRILAGFLTVLAAVLAAVVVPLGVTITAQQRHDFADTARAAARAVAAVAEERLDDHAGARTLPRTLGRVAGHGDTVSVLTSTGTVLARTGPPLPSGVLAAARAGTLPTHAGRRLLVAATAGAREHPVGLVLLARDTGPLNARARVLWLTLAAAAAAAIIVGGLVSWSLARWINRPLAVLRTATHGLGAGVPTARADPRTGPPEIRELAGAFNEMADRVTTLLDAQRAMTADVSHQLRTPLAAMRLRLELLAGDLDGDPGEEITALLTETNRLARLADGLLTIARADAGTPAPVPVDVAAVCAARANAWQPIAEERAQRLHLDTHPALAALTAGHLDQILDNLLANAIDAAPAGSTITLTARHDRGGVLLRVIDHGPGMTPEQRAHAFDRFTTDRRHGTGLGLAIVGRLAATDRATINLQETRGGGLTAQLHLPAAEPHHGKPSPTTTPQR